MTLHHVIDWCIICVFHVCIVFFLSRSGSIVMKRRRSSSDEDSIGLNPGFFLDETEVVVPPLQTLTAFTSPAVVKQSPKTPAPPLLNSVAEIMFLVKITPLSPTTEYQQILTESLDDARVNWRQDVNLNGSSFEFTIFIDDAVLAEATADNPIDAERKAFLRTVKRMLNSDYCYLNEERRLTMYCTASDAPEGSFRYDLLCQEKRLPRNQVPVCESCHCRGHVKRYCFLGEDVGEPETKVEFDDHTPPPSAEQDSNSSAPTRPGFGQVDLRDSRCCEAHTGWVLRV